jgi:hypothetical protein
MHTSMHQMNAKHIIYTVLWTQSEKPGKSEKKHPATKGTTVLSFEYLNIYFD